LTPWLTPRWTAWTSRSINSSSAESATDVDRDSWETGHAQSIMLGHGLLA
jgi:hypothetical protein